MFQLQWAASAIITRFYVVLSMDGSLSPHLYLLCHHASQEIQLPLPGKGIREMGSWTAQEKWADEHPTSTTES